MGLFKKTPEERAAIDEMKAADAALHEYGKRARKAGIDYETPENERLSKAANEAADKVGFWHGGNKRRS